MKCLKLFLSVVMILLVQEIFAQQNGSLFLSGEILKQNAYTFKVEEPYIEYAHPELFRTANWKYHSGDDLNWKAPTFNDSTWKLFRTDFNLDSIPKNEWQGIGWFRLKLIIDSSLFNQQLALVITQFGAAEIYFDGKLITRYGVPSKDPEIEKTFRPLNLQPVIISLDDQSPHLLAVRYSFLQANKLFDQNRRSFIFKHSQIGYPGFMVHFGNAKETIDQFGDSLKRNLLFAIITFITLFLIGSFHASLYLFYSRYRSNLFLAIFNFTLAGFSFTRWLPTYANLDLQATMLNNLLLGILWNFWLPVSMLAFYAMFYRKLPWYAWLYFLGLLLMVYDWFFTGNITFKIHNWIMFIAFLDMLRLFARSVIKKIRNVWIIGIGVLISHTSWFFYLNPSTTWAYSEFVAYCVLLAVPVSLLIFNASRTAGISKSLEKQLVEVKRLSDLNLAKEKEKQQILTAQKEILEQQVQDRTAALSQTLDDLKSTQAQLIQSAKMASLGELTAGIAHEIQNPLNFVNNFSEVNIELIEELKAERQKAEDERNTQLEDELLNDLSNNLVKINHHGKKADAIVKGMLQHSQSSSGIKEPTDINALADECLRLSFNGFRAKDKNFVVLLKTDYNESIGNINIIAQDIGRVLLNLYNNAFYAVDEKKTAESGKQKAEGNPYEPTVTVSTKKVNGKVEIKVADNGNGIPQKILDKIFQPFFTTKPTGQGTGLGLSLSYDIVKAHGGKIKVETKEGAGTEFIIQLPIV